MFCSFENVGILIHERYGASSRDRFTHQMSCT